MGDVIQFDIVKDDDAGLSPDEILESVKGKYRDVLVLGYTHDDGLYAAASDGLASGRDILWAMELFRHYMMQDA